MTQKTYDEWMASGFHVVKGQKASGRDDNGKATFSHFQVEANEYNPPKRNQDYGQYDRNDEGYEYEGSWEETLGGYWDNMDHLHAL